jgi:hypothetical protein
VLGYRFRLFLRFFYWILELFRQCGIFIFFIESWNRLLIDTFVCWLFFLHYKWTEILLKVALKHHNPNPLRVQICTENKFNITYMSFTDISELWCTVDISKFVAINFHTVIGRTVIDILTFPENYLECNTCLYL